MFVKWEDRSSGRLSAEIGQRHVEAYEDNFFNMPCLTVELDGVFWFRMNYEGLTLTSDEHGERVFWDEGGLENVAREAVAQTLEEYVPKPLGESEDLEAAGTDKDMSPFLWLAKKLLPFLEGRMDKVSIAGHEITVSYAEADDEKRWFAFGKPIGVCWSATREGVEKLAAERIRKNESEKGV